MDARVRLRHREGPQRGRDTASPFAEFPFAHPFSLTIIEHCFTITQYSPTITEYSPTCTKPFPFKQSAFVTANDTNSDTDHNPWRMVHGLS